MSNSGQQQAGGSGSDGGIWIFVIVMVIIWALLTFKIELFASPIAYIRLLELKLFLYIPILPDSVRIEMEYYEKILIMVQHNPSHVNSEKLFELNNLASKYTYYFFLAIMGYMGYKVFMHKRFNKIYNMDSLLESQGIYWGRTAMFTTHKLDTKDIYKGEWSISTKPHHYALKNKIWDKESGDFYQDRARNLLTKQLGKELALNKKPITDLYPITKKWPLYAKHAYAILSLRMQVNAIANAKLMVLKARNEIQLEKEELDRYKKVASQDQGKFSKMAESLIQDLGRAYAFDEFDDVNQRTEEILKTYRKSDVLIEKANKHKYYYTYFAGLLDMCREVGVLASADFLWLKKFDRRLWYTMNNVGRRVGWAEVSGIWSHYIAERATGTRLDTPHVDGAIEAFKRYLTPPQI